MKVSPKRLPTEITLDYKSRVTKGTQKNVITFM